jgi:asparagine N-glycosylation enzyme membrane subunit Stt3
MPFGLDYLGTAFNSRGEGFIWLVFSFIFFFVFSYLAMRGKDDAVKISLYVTVCALVVNMFLVMLSVSAFWTGIIGIVVYLIVTQLAVNMQVMDFIKTICIVFTNYTIMLFVPDFLIMFYTIIVLYVFYVISEKRISEAGLGGPVQR